LSLLLLDFILFPFQNLIYLPVETGYAAGNVATMLSEVGVTPSPNCLEYFTLNTQLFTNNTLLLYFSLSQLAMDYSLILSLIPVMQFLFWFHCGTSETPRLFEPYGQCVSDPRQMHRSYPTLLTLTLFFCITASNSPRCYSLRSGKFG
jgi:hypothetical protein